MNEETIQAARAAFKRDPETACQAMLGCSAEEMFVTALRGCNQHKHKPGCPDADGGGDKSWADKSTAEKLKSALATQKKAREKAESNYSEENRGMLNAANARVDKYERKLLEEETELFKGASYVQKHRDENFTSSTKTVGLNDAREFARGDGYRRYKNKGGNLVVYSPSSGYEMIFDDKKLAILAESPNA